MSGRRTPILVVLLALLFPACSGKVGTRVLVPNQPPEVRLTSDPASEPQADAHAWHVYWQGNDPDGHIDHYLIAVDPRSADRPDTNWIHTTTTDRILTFRDAHTNSLDPVVVRHPHVFAVIAVDDRGAASAVATRAFFLDNVAPEVTILKPHPSFDGGAVLVGGRARITWSGIDPDDRFRRPVQYRFRLFGPGDPEVRLAATDPDSIRRAYAPTFPGWDSLPGESTSVVFEHLSEGDYLFAITANDSVGDYDPVFLIGQNLLAMHSSGICLGPAISVSGPSFSYTYASGGWSTDSSRVVRIEVPAQIRVRFNWSAQTPFGSDITCYRWALDIANLHDETPRSDENTDVHHWSRCSPTLASASVGPFTGLSPEPNPHHLYIEAYDDLGCVSLAIIEIAVVVRPVQPKPLLVVNDTRLLPDNKLFFPAPANPDSLQNPPGLWPSRAELDTFLFAVGGVRWKYTPTTPAVTLSYPGVFAGYDYDTIYTRTMSYPGRVPLATLLQYEHVIWITDVQGWNIANAPTTGVSALYLMSGPGMQNTLDEYVALGGKAWAVGGGFCGSTMMNGWNARPNDLIPPPLPRFSDEPYGGAPAELVPGRFMYDWARWRSEIWLTYTAYPIVKSKRIPADGSWTNTPCSATCPPYSQLVNELRPKSIGEPNLFNPDGTSRYPYRDYEFYDDTQAHAVEIIPGNNNLSYTAGMGMGANHIIESTGDGADSMSTLDTIMVVKGGGTLPQNTQDLSDPAHFNENVVMTYYHGPHCPPFLFSGFDLWTWARPDLIGLVDFVLQDVWGLSRQPVDRTGPARARAPAIQSSLQPPRRAATPSAVPPPGARAVRPGSGGRDPAARLRAGR